MPLIIPLPSLAVNIAALNRHYHEIIVPLWQSNGWNSTLRLPHEALDSVSGLPLEATRYRAMACARQLYIFSHAGLPGSSITARADELFASLQFYFADGRGGWIYSVDAAGIPFDKNHDLYTYAFVIFACAEYFKQSGNACALQLMRQTVERVDQFFPDGNGLYVSTLGEELVDIGSATLQNPIMHLTEAYLAAYSIDGDVRYLRRLRGIGAAIFERFVDLNNGCVAELPQGEVGNRIEPGHQFEWFSLVNGVPAVFDGSDLELAMRRAFRFAQLHGVDKSTLGVKAALSADGTVLDAKQRIWAQTEFARALAMEGSAQSISILTQWTHHYRTNFLHSGGWCELLGATGETLRLDMPSSTPYHLFSAYLALQDLRG